jgi:hypothetical protein
MCSGVCVCGGGGSHCSIVTSAGGEVHVCVGGGQGKGR